MLNPDNYLPQVLYTNCRKVFFLSKKDNLGTSISIFLKIKGGGLVVVLCSTRHVEGKREFENQTVFLIYAVNTQFTYNFTIC